VVSKNAFRTKKRRKKKGNKKDEIKKAEQEFNNAIQHNIVKNIKKIARKTRKNSIPLKYDAIIKLNKPDKSKSPKRKETSFTYPRGILRGHSNFVPRKKVSHNIKTFKKRKQFNMLPADQYNQNNAVAKDEIVCTVKPIIKTKSGRKHSKTAKNKRYTLSLQEPKKHNKRNFTPIITKSFDANEIQKLMDAITYDGVLEMRIQKEDGRSLAGI
jgi:hypothetical protein